MPKGLVRPMTMWTRLRRLAGGVLGEPAWLSMRPGGAVGVVLALAAAISLTATGCERKTRDTDIRIISVSEMKLLMDREAGGRSGEIILVDPRPERAYEQAHIPGARNIQLPHIDPRSRPHPELARHRNIVVYGEDPGSAVARGMTKRLIAVGHRGVRLYAGGMREWRSRGYEVVSTGRPEDDEPGAEQTAQHEEDGAAME